MKTSEKSLVELRTIAVKTLAQVYNSTQSLEQSLFEELTRKNANTFADFDRGWIYEICSGVLRHRGRLDYIIDTYALKKKPSGPLRRYLQIGVYQLLEQDVPSALAVSETVGAIREKEGEAPSKFANAILRKVADAAGEWKGWQVTEKSPFDEQLAWCSLPEWMFKRLRKERGSEWVFAFSKACLDRPVTWYKDLAQNKTVALEGGYQGNEPFGYVQDISNQSLVEEVIKELQERFKDTPPKILDLCSAPGGKSLGLALAGFNVDATDIDNDRLQKVVENRSRLKLQDKIKILPHAEVSASEKKWDVIWVDAPCSSTGIIRRHPEVKWNRSLEDLERLQKIQQELVRWSAEHLEEGGILVYSTCSLIKSENEIKEEALKEIRALEYFPQNALAGDGIVARVYQKARS